MPLYRSKGKSQKLLIGPNSRKHAARWQCMCMFGVIAFSPYSSTDFLRSNPSATQISSFEIVYLTNLLHAKTNFLQQSSCGWGRRSDKQYTEKYNVQFFHWSAVENVPGFIDEGIADQVQEVQQYSLI